MEIMKMTASTCCSTSRSPATLATQMTRRSVFMVIRARIMLLSAHKWLHQTFGQVFSSNKKKSHIMWRINQLRLLYDIWSA